MGFNAEAIPAAAVMAASAVVFDLKIVFIRPKNTTPRQEMQIYLSTVTGEMMREKSCSPITTTDQKPRETYETS